MSDMQLKTTFTLAEAARLLSCHPETLRRAIRSGQLQAAKLGRGFRISRIDLESFWTSCGGGNLFDQIAELSEDEPATSVKPPGKSKVKKSQRQLSFFVSDDDE